MKFTLSKLKRETALAGALVASLAATPAHGAPPEPPVAPAAPAAPARAPAATGESEAHFQRGIELHQEQDFAGALVEFRRSYELAPTYKMLYNIGQVCYQVNDYACALRSFESYLKDGDANVSSERRAEVERELRKLRARVGRLEIVANLPGVEVSIDDVPVGTTPLRETVVVSTGRRHVTGTRDGFAPVSRFIEVAGADSSRVQLTFVKGDAGPRPTDAPPREPRWNTLSWLGTGAAVALAGAAGVTGALALGASADVRDARYAAGAGPSATMLADQDRARGFALASDVCLGLSAATLAATLLYTFVHTPRARESAAGAAPKLAPRAAAGGALFVGTF